MTRITIEQAVALTPKGWTMDKFNADGDVKYSKGDHSLVRRGSDARWRCVVRVNTDLFDGVWCGSPEIAIRNTCGIVTRRKMDFIQALIEVSNHG